MAQAKRTETFQVSKQAYYQAITDYEAYKGLVSAVKSVNVLERNGDQAKVKYEISIVKTFSYVLNLKETPNEALSWTLVESDIFKHNNGSWALEGDENQVTVTYQIDVGLPLLAPKAIVDKLVGSTLPQMMKDFADHAKQKFS